MHPIHLGLVQISWTGDRASLMTIYRRLVAEAAEAGAEIVCLPEFSLSPYFASERAPAGLGWAEALRTGPSALFFGELARQHQITLVGSIFEVETSNDARSNYWDTAVCFDAHGELAGYTRKVHIPSGEGYHENDYYPGADQFPVHSLPKVRLALPTCYDQWFPELARIYALNGAELIFYPTAIGSEPNAPEIDSQPAWQTVMCGHAIANGLFVAAANRSGREGNLQFYGSSFICDPMGNILAQAGRDTNEVIMAKLDPQVMDRWRELFPLLYQRRPEVYGRLLDPVNLQSAPEWLQAERR